jgi:hypothetical protein
MEWDMSKESGSDLNLDVTRNAKSPPFTDCTPGNGSQKNFRQQDRTKLRKNRKELPSQGRKLSLTGLEYSNTVILYSNPVSDIVEPSLT